VSILTYKSLERSAGVYDVLDEWVLDQHLEGQTGQVLAAKLLVHTAQSLLTHTTVTYTSWIQHTLATWHTTHMSTVHIP